MGSPELAFTQQHLTTYINQLDGMGIGPTGMAKQHQAIKDGRSMQKCPNIPKDEIPIQDARHTYRSGMTYDLILSGGGKIASSIDIRLPEPVFGAYHTVTQYLQAIIRSVIHFIHVL